MKENCQEDIGCFGCKQRQDMVITRNKFTIIMFRELSVSEPSESVMMVPMVETVMWVQREKKMFPRWKERVVVITGEELYCYKKGSAQLSDVGSLMFKVTWPLNYSV